MKVCIQYVWYRGMQEYLFVDQIPVFIVQILCKYVFTFVINLICLSQRGPR